MQTGTTLLDHVLLESIEDGDISAARCALSLGANPAPRKLLTVTRMRSNSHSTQSTAGQTKTARAEPCLCLAILRGDADLVELLVQGGIDVSKPVWWKVPDYTLAEPGFVWHRGRWCTSVSFPSALCLAVGAGGVQLDADERTTSPLGQRVRVNKPGAHVLVFGQGSTGLWDTMELKGNLEMVETLLRCGAKVGEEELRATPARRYHHTTSTEERCNPSDVGWDTESTFDPGGANDRLDSGFAESEWLSASCNDWERKPSVGHGTPGGMSRKEAVAPKNSNTGGDRFGSRAAMGATAKGTPVVQGHTPEPNAFLDAETFLAGLRLGLQGQQRTFERKEEDFVKSSHRPGVNDVHNPEEEKREWESSRTTGRAELHTPRSQKELHEYREQEQNRKKTEHVKKERPSSVLPSFDTLKGSWRPVGARRSEGMRVGSRISPTHQAALNAQAQATNKGQGMGPGRSNRDATLRDRVQEGEVMKMMKEPSRSEGQRHTNSPSTKGEGGPAGRFYTETAPTGSITLGSISLSSPKTMTAEIQATTPGQEGAPKLRKRCHRGKEVGSIRSLQEVTPKVT
ncbi:hypothetical protein M427DRAFT_42877 [Gonapodya prolifera JEL478]|uniref:Ankyrin n=1 Tax=Gonapodya prolifera (strain JEL478) TaxID=1344416 RepID=A0A139AMP5_GONPJ|nr:hypothetical protein M427DRAFT_42877 [Gonapodya prolifera JEL478]|eukprot:KXS17803.1 hypothetical protein M427DRAFT_42877 [Gonapodya prolifera JEL478]